MEKMHNKVVSENLELESKNESLEKKLKLQEERTLM
jgi:hypothetical protein